MKLILLLIVVILLSACSFFSSSVKNFKPLQTDHLPMPDMALNIANFGSCSNSKDRTFNINSNYPITIFVHGRNGSAGNFRDLAQLYADYGQQSVCFSYPQRESLSLSADKLAFSLQQLIKTTHNKNIAVLGHSLGGLIARKALETHKKEDLVSRGINIKLITIATPFAGIEAASPCTSHLLNWMSLGVIPSICWGIVGDSWSEITTTSDFIKHPKPLLPVVHHHLNIITNEINTCRNKNAIGECIVSDYIFELSEQHNVLIDRFSSVKNIQVNAGHVEIIGYKQHLPFKLLAILQREHMLF